MADVVDAATRSRMMAGIKGKNTSPELVIRRHLHRRGFRFKLHPRTLPGKPDIILPRYKAAILVHGCFWHRHCGCRYATSPKTRPDFWEAKFASNIRRDADNEAKLRDAGWRIARVWECAVRRDPEAVTHQLSVWLPTQSPVIDIGAKDGLTVVNTVEHFHGAETQIPILP